MLTNLGWNKGQSLGKHSDGILEPVCKTIISENVYRLISENEHSIFVDFDAA